MSNESQHINPWAGKLQEASIPDANASWKDMERLLDQHLPVEERKKRWRFLILFFIFCAVVGVCFFQISEFGLVKKQADYSHQPVGKSLTVPGNTGTENAKLEEERRSSTQVLEASALVSNKIPVASFDTAIAKRKAVADRKIENNGYRRGQKARSGAFATAITSSERSEKTYNEDAIQKDGRNGGDRKKALTYTRSKRITSLKTSRNKSSLHVIKGANRLAEKKRAVKEDTTIQGLSLLIGVETGPKSSIRSVLQNTDATNSPTLLRELPSHRKLYSPITQTISKDRLHKLQSSVLIDSQLHALNLRGEEINKKGWTFGVGLNHFFQNNFLDRAAAKERAEAYNSDGISRRVADYIPIPQVRYWFNNRWVIQGELQFNSPQYAQQVLLDQHSYRQGSSFIMDTVYVKKLSYFNLPLGVYYSPLKNMYIGGGIQLSRLTNALALYSQTKLSLSAQPGDTLKAKVAKVQSIRNNDTLYKRIHTTELRLFGDINYQVKRFIVGVRYNYALRDFVKVPVVNNSAITQARNSSLQLYLRYTFLDKRKRIKPALK